MSVTFTGGEMAKQLAALQNAYSGLYPALAKAGVARALRKSAKPVLQVYQSFARSRYPVSKISYRTTKTGRVKAYRIKGRLEKSAGISNIRRSRLEQGGTGIQVGYRRDRGGYTAAWLGYGTKPRATRQGWKRGQVQPTGMLSVIYPRANASALSDLPKHLVDEFNKAVEKQLSAKYEPVAKRYKAELLRKARKGR